MRYIDITDKKPQNAWINRADKANKKMIKISDQKKRAVYINNNQPIWKDLKKWLLDLSYGKCWYSEVKNIGEDWHVDHFRPKNCAKDKDGTIIKEDGYWWLAFDWKNYRIATTWCNCRRKENGKTYGKGEYFPIRKGSPNIKCDDDCSLEVYHLIDPTKEEDVRLLSFDASGSVIAMSLEPWECERVEVSKDIYHLESQDLKYARRKKWIDCVMYIERINKYTSPQNLNKEVVSLALDEIKKLIDPTESLSSVAIACLLSSGYEWAKEVIKYMDKNCK